MSDLEQTPVGKIVGGAGVVALVLLLAPWTPPQLAVIGFIAIAAIGVTVHFGVRFVSELLYETADEALPELPDEYEEYPVSDDTMNAYLEGEMSDEEFENRVEEGLLKEEQE